ncbi:MAG: glycosyltransferase [Breznakibacter sp.]
MKDRKRKPVVRICLTGDMNTDYRVHKTAMSLLAMGFDVVCVSRKHSHFVRAVPRAYCVVLLSTIWEKGPFFYFAYNLRLFFYLLSHRSQVVLSIDLDTLPGCALAAKIKRIPLVFDSHEYFPEVPELQHRPVIKRAWTLLEKTFVPWIDKGYTVCRSIACIYGQKYGIDFEVVRNLPSAMKSENVKAAIHDPRFKLVYQGAVNLGRGLLETVSALPLLDDVVLIVVGDGDIIRQVKNKVVELDVADKVVFIGKVPFAQLAAYTASADLGLCLLENLGLNYYYSLPNRIFDFALAGVPILASNFPEIADVVGKFRTGVLVNDLSPATIACAIEQIRCDKDTYRQISANALEVGRKLVWENELPVLEKVYRPYLT